MRKIFNRYIASGFWAPFAFGLAVFCLLLTFGSLFDRLNFFMKSNAGVGVFLRHIVYQTPYFAVKMIPLSTLLAVLFSLGGMVSRGEWKAGMAGGWRPLDMIKPLLACAVLAGAGQLLLQETLAPDLFLRSEHIMERDVKAKADWREQVKADVAFSAGDDLLVTAHVFNGLRREMDNVMLSVYKDGRLNTEYNAGSASWDASLGRWVFKDGIEVVYGKSVAPVVTPFKSRVSDVSVPPEDLVLEKLVPDGITTLELLRRIKRLKAVGAPSVQERTLLWVKIAAPLANPVMALIGAAMALLLRGNNKIYSFGLAIGCGFFFWAVIILSQQAGNAELLSPMLSGLAPCLGFAVASFWGLKRARAF